MYPPIKNIWLFVTKQCNLACDYCYINRSANDIKEADAYKIMDVVSKSSYFKRHHIVLFGGEPLLKMSLIKKIVNYGNNISSKNGKDLTFSIYSNGTLFKEKTVKELRELNVGLDLSFDGIKLSHDQARVFKNNKSSFESIFGKIPNLLAFYPYSMVHACITPNNVNFLDENFLFFRKLGFKRIYFQPVTSIDWSDNAIKLFKSKLRDLFELYQNILKDNEKIYLNIFEDYMRKLQYQKENIVNPCPAGVYNFAFSDVGEIFPCHRFATLHLENKEFEKLKKHYCLGNIKEEIKNKSLVRDFFNFNYNNREQCKECGIKEVCLSSCHWEHFYKNKNFKELNITVCKIQKILCEEVDYCIKKYPKCIEINLKDYYKGKNLPNNNIH